MKNIKNQEKINDKPENSDQNTTKKRRGKPFKNAELHKVFELEFKKLSPDLNLSGGNRKVVKTIAETMLVQGFSVTEIAESLSIPKSTVCLWNSKLDDETKAKIEQNVLNSISSNVSQFLNTSLLSMEKAAIHCSSPEYLETQSIKDVAKFFETFGNFALNFIEIKNEEFSLKEIGLKNSDKNKHS